MQYKVLYMGRHGEGYHNTAETYYGTPAWNVCFHSLTLAPRKLTWEQCYWSLQDGNGTVTWADARITPNGVAQAQKANAFWASRIKLQKIPLPETYYTSPLTRCLQTANITFFGLDLPDRQPFIPTVKELFREGISGHTCDRRGTKTYIHDAYPAYKIEAGFSETDLLWKPLHGEVSTDQDIRSKKVLDDVFGSDDSTYISITSHSGEIASILRGMLLRLAPQHSRAERTIILTHRQFLGIKHSLYQQEPSSQCWSKPRPFKAILQRRRHCHGRPYQPAALFLLFQLLPSHHILSSRF